jgi:ubiquinone/menaquinone biosynthesis C-methylase UbiE
MSISIHDIIGDTDIYLLDQIMKDRYDLNNKILDAGCGNGRNLHWFLLNNISIYGIDSNAGFINNLKTWHTNLPSNRFQVAAIESMPFETNFFDHLICSAVLHFAHTTSDFKNMMAELVRVLKPQGSLFIRMTSNIGIETHVELIEDGVYHIPDGSVRFLLTKELLTSTMLECSLSFIEPLKTVNVNDIRCMSTLMLKKN